MNSKADLGCYINKCYFDGFTRAFDRGITHLRPLLERNRINWILLHPGSFNPPNHFSMWPLRAAGIAMKLLLSSLSWTRRVSNESAEAALFSLRTRECNYGEETTGRMTKNGFRMVG